MVRLYPQDICWRNWPLLARCAVGTGVILFNSIGGLPAESATNPAAPVTLRESDKTFFLDNGILSARIEKSSGEVFSIRYQGRELLAQKSPGGALGGYWSSVGRARPGGKREAVVRIDPKTNRGERVEISCNFHNGPGAADAPLDMDVRYSLGRGENWLYTYLVWSHPAGYPPFSVGEARFCAKLEPEVFDYMTIDQDRRRVMPTPEDWDRGAPLNLKEARRMTTGLHQGEVEHKYDYSAVIHEIPAYGWSSTKYKLGLWFVNPSFEYMAGGPTKAELTGHLDVNPGGVPTLLNMWLGSHYGGSSLSVGVAENWTKVVGPMLIYCNAAVGHEAMWQEALARAQSEAKRWPYDWLVDSNYPGAKERGTVSGQIRLRDPLEPGARMSNVWVGVTAPDYFPPLPRFGGGATAANPARFAGRGGFPPFVDWQRDAKFYQFWTRADADGRFEIRNVRPGNYTLRGIADGVIGEFALTNVAVAAAERKSVGGLVWVPQRFGRTLWQIGVADRTAREFKHGDHYWQWGLYFKYAREFPQDVNFVIGQSDWREDWNYVQPPRLESEAVKAVSEADEASGRPVDPRGLNRREVLATTWSIAFTLTNAVSGTATLRLAFCGTHTGCNVEVLVNEQSVGETGLLPSTSAMQRDGIRAFWVERPVSFDAGRLRPGQNVIKLRSKAETWSQGVMYDCVRLEASTVGAVSRATAEEK